jgi:hypothetical protein
MYGIFWKFDCWAPHMLCIKEVVTLITCSIKKVLEFILHYCHSKLTPSMSDKVFWRQCTTLCVTRSVVFVRHLVFRMEHDVSEAGSTTCISGGIVRRHLPSCCHRRSCTLSLYLNQTVNPVLKHGFSTGTVIKNALGYWCTVTWAGV